MKKYRTYNLLGDFSSGVLSPAGQDNEKKPTWLSGAAEMCNFDILRDGGIRGRCGFLSQPNGRINYPRYDAVLGDAVDSDGVHPVSDRTINITEDITDVATQPRRWQVFFEDRNIIAITWHNVRFIDGTWRYDNAGGESIPTLRVETVARDSATPVILSGGAGALPPTQEGADPLIEGQRFFLPGQTPRDITVRMPRPLRLSEAFIRVQAVGWLAQAVVPEGGVPRIHLECDGVSALSYGGEANNDLSNPETPGSFVRSPVRITSWVIRDVAFAFVIRPDRIVVYYIRPDRTLQQLSNAGWSFTPRQIRELTWTQFGEDLLLTHHDFYWPLRVRLNTEQRLTIEYFRLNDVPIADARIVADSQLSLTLRGPNLSIRRTGTEVTLGDEPPERIEAFVSNGGIRVNWSSTGATLYQVFWLTEEEYVALGGTESVDPDAGGPLTREDHFDDLSDEDNDARRALFADADAPARNVESSQLTAFIPAASVVPGNFYVVGVGVTYQNQVIYPVVAERILARHPNPTIPANVNAVQTGFIGSTPGYTLAWNPVPNADFYVYQFRRLAVSSEWVDGGVSAITRTGTPPNVEHNPAESIFIPIPENTVTDLRVRAGRFNVEEDLDTASYSEWSPAIRVVHGESPPGQVELSLVVDENRNDRVTASWMETDPNAVQPTGYELRYRPLTTPPPPWVDLAPITDATVLSRDVVDLMRDTSYEMELRATRRIEGEREPITGPWDRETFQTSVLPASLPTPAYIGPGQAANGFLRFTIDDAAVNRVFNEGNYYIRAIFRRAGVTGAPTEDQIIGMGDLDTWEGTGAPGSGEPTFGTNGRFMSGSVYAGLGLPSLRADFLNYLGRANIWRGTTNERRFADIWPYLALGNTEPDAPAGSAPTNHGPQTVTDFGTNGTILTVRVRIEWDPRIERGDYIVATRRHENYGGRPRAASNWTPWTNFRVFVPG